MILSYKQILVTRAREQASDISNLIRKHGGIPIECPLISTRFPQERNVIMETIQQLEQYEWIVFTSMNGVHRFFDLFSLYRKPDFSKLSRWKFAVVGEKTRKALADKGLSARIMPDVYEASHLYTALVQQLRGNESILLARGNLAKEELAQRLSKDGFQVTDLIVYETYRNEESRELLYPMIINRELDMITFTSPSTVRYFVEILEGYEWRSAVKPVKIACIGPVTSKEAEKMNLNVDIVAPHFTSEGLVSEIVRYYQQIES